MNFKRVLKKSELRRNGSRIRDSDWSRILFKSMKEDVPEESQMELIDLEYDVFLLDEYNRESAGSTEFLSVVEMKWLVT